MDPRLSAADGWRNYHRWLEARMDEMTMQQRHAKQMERQLREDVEREREAARLQAAADAELVRRPGRKARAA